MRFHGPSKLYSSGYSAEELKPYAQIIKEKTKKGKDVFCYFNNDSGGYAVRDTVTLRDLAST